MQCFLECDHDVCFDVAPAFHRCLTASESSKSRSAAASAEKRLEKIAEPGSAKFKLNSVIATPFIKSAAWLLPSPLRRRLKSSRLVPIGPQLIVFLSLFRIAQNFIRLVDLFELFFGGLFVLRHIGMMFARQFAKCAPDLIISRCFRYAERFVVIPELHRHGSEFPA